MVKLLKKINETTPSYYLCAKTLHQSLSFFLSPKFKIRPLASLGSYVQALYMIVLLEMSVYPLTSILFCAVMPLYYLLFLLLSVISCTSITSLSRLFWTIFPWFEALPGIISLLEVEVKFACSLPSPKITLGMLLLLLSFRRELVKSGKDIETSSLWG